MKSESERKTRKQRIDPKLQAAGWKIVDYDFDRPLSTFDRCAIAEYATSNGPVDYALCIQGRIVAVVEAKKVTLGPQNVLTQAERYARGIDDSPYRFGEFRIPFLYSTNGEVIWHHDVRNPMNRSRQIASFHSPDALIEMLGRDIEASCRSLADLPNDHPMIRPYQKDANRAIEGAITDRKQKMLVAMATGTGKTYTLVNQIYRLMKSGTSKRILFLVDRRALAAQAVRAFASFEAEPGLKFDKIYEVYSQRFFRDDLGEDDKFDPKVLPSSYLISPKPGHAFVYVCTIQRMTINLFGRNAVFGLGDESIDDDAEVLPIPNHAFDCIIADECHRGYTSAELSVWRQTLDHFDAVKIGLTATPAAHTTAYFGHPVYRYEYERAVREGFLVDYDVVKIKSNVRMNGIFLEPGAAVGRVDTETGLEQMDLLEDERKFDSTEIEQNVTSPDSNLKILKEIQKYTEEHERQYGRFPKTLVFAVNDLPHRSHADQLVDTARDVFGRGEAFVQKITGHADRQLQRIREFRNRPNPCIVVTVDMLSTGVDIPDLEFIVFLRPVKSRILFEQMIGRGTRRGERFPDKSHFMVFDCFDGTLIEYFRKTTGMTAELMLAEPRSILQIIEDIWNNADRDYNIRCLVKRLHRIDKEMSGNARIKFAVFIPDGDMKKFAVDLQGNLRRDFTGTMALLRNPDLQHLLVHYERSKPVFYKDYQTEDQVESATLIRDGLGQTHKPEDYLHKFMEFVRENESRVQAIAILLNRPKAWNPSALVELNEMLKKSPPYFEVASLQKAHQICYQKALVDIISMVKHAAVEKTPLMTAEERVDAALAKVTARKMFDYEQRRWLALIRDHLVQNLSIDVEDFKLVQIFERAGGLGKAKKVFGKELEPLIHEINTAIAA
jgi:type I restriction enzyme, R subunit